MGAAVRLDRWPVILAKEIDAARSRPFAWGMHDCVTWAFTVAFALRGEPGPEWAGTYRTEIGAKRKLRRHGLELQDLGAAVLGRPLDGPLTAWRGDLTFVEGAYGVCIGQDIAVVGLTGLELRPLSSAAVAWRV